MIPRLELSAIVWKRLCSSCAVTPTDLVFALAEGTSAVASSQLYPMLHVDE